MKYSLILIISCFVICNSKYSAKEKSQKIGAFWHLSDIHVDQNYSRTGNPNNLCHELQNNTFPDNGLYGNDLCDSPQILVNATFDGMKKIEPNPDFIIWTGDNLPHTNVFNPDWNEIFETLYNLTVSLKKTFPGVPFFPCIGNHDTFPPNVLLPNKSSQSIYVDILNKGGWNAYLTNESSTTFITGGFYSQVIRPGLRIISLNTILWYSPNNYTEKMEDPLNQFSWFEETLENCLKFSEMVYIIGHVPPGFYNRVKPGERSLPTYHSQYLISYLRILNKFSKIILGQMFGHLHIDMFQLFQSSTGSFESSSLLASSITPWHFSSPENLSIPVNPSVRLVYYDQETGFLKDYNQYFFNLTKANNLNGTKISSEYELLYTFTDAYNVPDLSTTSLVAVYEKIKKSDDLFQKFYTFSTAGKRSFTCDTNCKVAQLCSISSTAIDDYNACMNKSISAENSGILLQIVLASFTLCLLSFLFFIYWKCKKDNNELYSKI